ncbi:OmpH family outer membrane protein [Lewinella cohaerens]|uniref:OmpH family outer membrane protein n=1 Tax=Lewinella cohaerens TaxID=70995 RepID=UPI00036B5DE2|nr:OmpH family outer membrane protein [Lewinella cohaerens]
MNIRLFGYLTCIVALGTLLSCQPQAATTEEGTTTASSSVGNIVFIRLDSLTNQYASLSEKTKALEARAIEADKGQNERVTAFQRDVQNYQRRANSGQMSPKDMGNEQERLAGREQALMQEAERLRQELQMEQMKLSAEFEENLMKVLEEIQGEFNYDYILSYGNGTGVLMVSDKNDITPEVAKRLNTIPMDGQMDSEVPTEADAAAPATEE